MEGRRPRREARDSPEGALSHCASLRASDSEVAQVSAGRSRQKESLAASPRAPGGLGCPVAHPEGRGAIAFQAIWTDIKNACTGNDSALALARIRSTGKHRTVFDNI